MRPVFVIGDVHGHYDRLVALLHKAGFLAFDFGDGAEEVPTIRPTGLRADIVQVGDLGHFGWETRVNDLLCYELARQLGITVLWGNHDYATQSPWHAFMGYAPPAPELLNAVHLVKPVFAVERHGYLITHAGLHPYFVHKRYDKTPLPEGQALGPGNWAAWINDHGDEVINFISTYRGGCTHAGGVLWRDDREPLYNGFPQVYGHTRGMIREHGKSVCIDVGDKADPGNLAGIWLPERRMVAVGPDASLHETPLVEA